MGLIIPMLQHSPEQMHMFILRINGTFYRDTTTYSDRELTMILDRYEGYLPGNIHVHHYERTKFPSDIVMAYPSASIPVYELTRPQSRNAYEGLRLFTRRGPRSGVPVVRRYFDYVWVEGDSPGGKIAFVDGREYKLLSKYTAIPVDFRYAANYVNHMHRDNVAPQGHKFSIALQSVEGYTVGVLIASEPKSRHQQDGRTLEINRCCADPRYHNVCTALNGKAIRMGKEIGYTRFLSYTLLTEGGASMLASGFQKDGIVKGRKTGWNSPSRPRNMPLRYPDGDKQRWVLQVA